MTHREKKVFSQSEIFEKMKQELDQFQKIAEAKWERLAFNEVSSEPDPKILDEVLRQINDLQRAFDQAKSEYEKHLFRYLSELEEMYERKRQAHELKRNTEENLI